MRECCGLRAKKELGTGEGECREGNETMRQVRNRNKVGTSQLSREVEVCRRLWTCGKVPQFTTFTLSSTSTTLRPLCCPRCPQSRLPRPRSRLSRPRSDHPAFHALDRSNNDGSWHYSGSKKCPNVYSFSCNCFIMCQDMGV